ncbi:MAG TPA: SRPBCC family protein [Meiothermus sp.]|nr:SRPBCC family protein [Meiothermus sp.]
MSLSCENPLRLKNEVRLWIPAPPERVWEFFSDFQRWPTWAEDCREVRRSAAGWYLVCRGEQGPDLRLAVRVTRLEPPHRLEFTPLEGARYDLEVSGWVACEPHLQGTQVCLWVEAQASPQARRLQRHPELWAGLLLEQSRGLLQDLRRALLEPSPTEPIQAEPLTKAARALPVLVYY